MGGANEGPSWPLRAATFKYLKQIHVDVAEAHVLDVLTGPQPS